jgi:hypothetical protein
MEQMGDMLDSTMRRANVAWSRWVICWILPCVERMWHLDERLMPLF